MKQGRRVLRLEKTLAIMATDSAGLPRVDSKGRYYVREKLSNGSYAPAVPLPLVEGAILPPRPGLVVELGYDASRQRVILGVKGTAATQQGLNRRILNAADPASRGLIRLEEFSPLRCIAHPTLTGYALVYPGRCLFGSTAVNYAGGDIDLLTSYKPSAGNHRYVGVFLTSAGALEAAGSTAQSTSSALDTTDRQEAIDAATTGSKLLKLFVITGADTELGDTIDTTSEDWRLYQQGGDSTSPESILEANTGASYEINWSAASIFQLTLTANCTFTFSNLIAGQSITVRLIQDGTGSRTAAWPVSVVWPNGTPSLATAAGSVDVHTFSVRANGTTVEGFSATEEVATADVLVKVSSNDTTAGYLEDKIAATEGVQKSTLNDGGDEDVQLKLDISGLTEDTNPDAVADVVAIYDASAGAHKKVALDALPSATRLLYSMIADRTVEDSVLEDTLFGNGRGVLTIPAGSLTVGTQIRIRAAGYLSDTGTPTLNVKAKLGGSEVCSTGANALASGVSGVGFQIETLITVRSTGATGTVVASGWFKNNDGTQQDMVKTTTTTVDTTAGLAADLTATWGAASASNTLTCQIASIEVLVPPTTAYTAATTDIRITEAGDARITENADTRVTES